MTAPGRSMLLVLALVTVLAAAPAASAATSQTFAGGVLTLTNDGDSETFGVTISSSAEPEYVVTSVNAVLPPVAGCGLSGGNKTLSCPNAAGISKLVLNGGAGNDTVGIGGSRFYAFSGVRDLEVNGGSGNDTFSAGTDGALLTPVRGGPDNDTFNGSATFGDSFTAEAGNDTYNGGTRPVPAGFDTGRYQRDYVADAWSADGAGAVRVSVDGVPNDVDGQGGTDQVRDVESLIGAGGSDALIAGPGAAYLSGGGGNDSVTGSSGDDRLYGNAGDDVLLGLGGDDELVDGDFEDSYRLVGQPPIVVGNDALAGGDGDDALHASAGRDDIRGNGGVDRFSALRIATQVRLTPPESATFATTYRGVTISLDDQANDGPTGLGEGDNVHSDVEDVDTTSSQTGGMWVTRSGRTRGGSFGGTNSAPDVITGSATANTIITGGGNDAVDGRAGSDTVHLGEGDDRANAVDRTTDRIWCGRGLDTVGADLTGTNPARADVVSSCESITGTPLGLEGGTLPTLPTAPRLTLGGKKKLSVKAFLKAYRLSATVTSNQSVSATGVVLLPGARIAKTGDLALGSKTLRRGTGKRRLTVRVAKKHRKALKRKLRTKKQRRKGIRLVLAVTVRNAAGQTQMKRRTVRIRR